MTEPEKAVPSVRTRRTPSRDERNESRRRALLAVAALRFNAQGLRRTTLAEIAADIGLATTSVSYYFRRKEDLAAACFERALEQQHRLAEQAAQRGGGDPAARAREFILAQAELTVAQDKAQVPPLIEFDDLRSLAGPNSAPALQGYVSLFRSVRGLLEGTEVPNRDALNVRAHLLLSASHWMRVLLRRQDAEVRERVAGRAADILVHGLAKGASAWPDVGDVPPMPSPQDLVAGQDPQRVAFLRAATQAINEEGYLGVSIERIARSEDRSRSWRELHDPRIDLISACFDHSHGVIRRLLGAVERAQGSGWMRICALTLALTRYQRSPQGPLLRITALSALPDVGTRDRVRADGHRLIDRTVGILADGMADGSLRPHDPMIATQLLSCATNAAAELGLWVQQMDDNQLFDSYLKPALLGLVGPASGAAPRRLPAGQTKRSRSRDAG